jgi:hypothetical protein
MTPCSWNRAEEYLSRLWAQLHRTDRSAPLHAWQWRPNGLLWAMMAAGWDGQSGTGTAGLPCGSGTCATRTCCPCPNPGTEERKKAICVYAVFICYLCSHIYNCMTKDICCIGHLTQDKIITPKSEVFMTGGTAFYMAYGHRTNCRRT